MKHGPGWREITWTEGGAPVTRECMAHPLVQQVTHQETGEDLVYQGRLSNEPGAEVVAKAEDGKLYAVSLSRWKAWAQAWLPRRGEYHG